MSLNSHSLLKDSSCCMIIITIIAKIYTILTIIFGFSRKILIDD